MRMCSKCFSRRVVTVDAKCSDLCNISLRGKKVNGTPPADMGIGGGDYVSFSYCLDCGQIQGEFPLSETKLERFGEEAEDEV